MSTWRQSWSPGSAGWRYRPRSRSVSGPPLGVTPGAAERGEHTTVASVGDEVETRDKLRR
ncbi:hypothetical protein MIC448_50007 [Microbacterium sp. C448]|nr:hypothetical protein MIC448_50007 [Microbacterium sp. C448]